MSLSDVFDISLETANKFYTWGWKASLVGAAITLIGVSLLMWGTRVRDHDTELQIGRANSDNARLRERAAVLENDAAQAKAGIAFAQTATAEVNERALKLEHDNLALRGKVATLEKGAADAGKELALLQTETADAKRQQAEAETKLAEVKKRQTPRNLRIPSGMMASLLKTGPSGKAIIVYQQADAESLLFAGGLRNRLEDAGWKILGFNAIPSSIVYGAGNEDMDLGMKNLVNGWPSDTAQVLVRAMNEAAIRVGAFDDPTLPDDTFRIVIHPKP